MYLNRASVFSKNLRRFGFINYSGHRVFGVVGASLIPQINLGVMYRKRIWCRVQVYQRQCHFAFFGVSTI